MFPRYGLIEHMNLSAKTILILICGILAINAVADNPIRYGSVAGTVYPPFDAVNLTGYVILTPLSRVEGDTALRKAENIAPIYIRRMFKGRVLCDSIPAGFYEALIGGVAYDSNFKVAATCIEQDLVNFRVAPDSVSIFSARLRKKADDEKVTWKSTWPEIIKPDNSEVVRIKGLYPNQAYDKLYNNVSLKRDGFLFTIEPNLEDSSAVNGLNLAVFSNKFYHGPDNELNVTYNVDGKDIVIGVEVVEHRSKQEDFQYRQPVYKLTNIPLDSSYQRILFISGDTSIYKIDIDSLDVNLLPVQEGKVVQYRKQSYCGD